MGIKPKGKPLRAREGGLIASGYNSVLKPAWLYSRRVFC